MFLMSRGFQDLRLNSENKEYQATYVFCHKWDGPPVDKKKAMGINSYIYGQSQHGY